MYKNVLFLVISLTLVVALDSCQKKTYQGFNNSPAYQQHFTKNESFNDLPCPDHKKQPTSSVKKTLLINPESSQKSEIQINHSSALTNSATANINVSKKETIKSGIKKLKEIKSVYKTKKEVPIRLSRALWLLIAGGVLTIAGLLLQSVFYTEIFTILFAIVFVIGVFALIRYLADPTGKKNMN